MASVLSDRVLPLATHGFCTESLLLTSEQHGTHWDSIPRSGSSGHPRCPHLPGCRILLLTGWPHLPQLLNLATHIGPCLAFCFLWHLCKCLWTLRSLCLSLSFFLDVLIANPTQLCFREVMTLWYKLHSGEGSFCGLVKTSCAVWDYFWTASQCEVFNSELQSGPKSQKISCLPKRRKI